MYKITVKIHSKVLKNKYTIFDGSTKKSKVFVSYLIEFLYYIFTKPGYNFYRNYNQLTGPAFSCAYHDLMSVVLSE